MKKAFSLITAIFLIVLMSAVAAFITNLSSKMTQETTTQYQREQASLLTKSYTEYAIMAVTANEHKTANCLNDINGTWNGYDINVNISYIGNRDNFPLTSSCSRILANDVNNTDSPLNIIVDVFVKYKNPDHPLATSAPDITYHRRSLQKI